MKGKEEYIIRKACLEDIPGIMLINQLTLPENYPEYFFQMHLEHWGEAFYVAVEDNIIVGYIMPRIETGLGLFTRFIVKKGHVISIAVRKEYRRKGVATKILHKSMDDMKNIYGAKEVYLEVRVSNEAAIKLYEKLEFKKIKIIHNYYSDGEDAYLMARKL